MKIKRQAHDVYIEPDTDISFITLADIQEQIDDFLQPDDQRLVLNLSKVQFIDSSGIGLLISLLKRMKNQSGEFVVEYPRIGVQKLLEMTRLDQLFEVRKKEEETTGSWSEFE